LDLENKGERKWQNWFQQLVLRFMLN
jgi:hypothetical protein